MNKITSRKNEVIRAFRDYRGPDLLCCGQKMLREALLAGAEITALVVKGDRTSDAEGISCSRVYQVPEDLFDYICPQKNSPGPLFTARARVPENKEIRSAVILENVQDPGNVGTVLRTANALDIDCVYLCGSCAALTNPKTIQSSMGAVFTQPVKRDCLPDLPIYGAALAEDAVNITDVCLEGCAVAIGSEGRGLTQELLDKCRGKIIIPMTERAESFNAAVAAAICMWEQKRGSLRGK